MGCASSSSTNTIGGKPAVVKTMPPVKPVNEAEPSVMIVTFNAISASNEASEFKKQKCKPKATFIGATRVTNRFQAVVVVMNNTETYSQFKDTLARFQTCPVVVFMCKETLIPSEFTECAKHFPCGAHAKVADYLRKRIGVVKADIQNVFQEFDADQNGKIDKKELKMVALDLGLDLGVAELNNMVYDIDFNKDGQIDPEEFSLWWLSGRKGAAGTMSQLLTRRIGGKKTIDGASKTFGALAKQTQTGVFKHKSHSVQVNFNGAEASKVKESMAIDAAVSVMGESNKALVAGLRQRICGQKELENEDDSAYFFLSLSIKLKASFTDKHNLCEAINMIQEDMTKDGPGGAFRFSYADGRVFIRTYMQKDESWIDNVPALMSMIKAASIFGDQKTDQNVSLTAMTGFNFGQFFAEDAAVIPNFIKKGAAKNVKLNLWDGFHKSLLSTAKTLMKAGDNATEKEADSGEFVQKFAPLLPLFVCNVNAKMDYDVKPSDIESMMGLPQAAMAKVNAHQLLTSMSPWGTCDDLELCHQTEEDAGDMAVPIWLGFEDRKAWTKPEDCFDSFCKRMSDIIATQKDKKELPENLMSGMNRGQSLALKVCHCLSMAADDDVEIETGIQIKIREGPVSIETDTASHQKARLQGKGIGEAIKAVMVLAASRGAFN